MSYYWYVYLHHLQSMTVIVQFTWYSMHIEMLLQELVIFLDITYTMENCTSIACHPQVLKPCHGTKPPTYSLENCCIPHSLLIGVGNQTKVFLNTLHKKNPRILLKVLPLLVVKNITKSSCWHGDMPTHVIFTIILAMDKNIYIKSSEHVDADKSTTKVFENTFRLVAADTVTQCNIM